MRKNINTKENKVQERTLMRSLRPLILAMALIISCTGQSVAQPEIEMNFEGKQCNEDVIAFRVDPEPIRKIVGEEYSLLLNEGKAMVAILIQDCEQYWIDGENLGTNQHVHILTRIEGPSDVRPVIGVGQTEPTLTWFSLFAGSTNPRDQEARKASHTAPEPIEEVSLSPLGSARSGRVKIGPDLSFTWKTGMVEASPHLDGYNHDIYLRDETGAIVLKRIQAIGKLAAKPVPGMLMVQGNDAIGDVIGAGQYPAMVYTLFPIWARGNLGEDLSNTSENNRTAILKYIEEMNKGNEDYLDEYFAPDVVFHGVSGDMNLDQFKAFHHQVLAAFPGAVMKAEDIFVSENKVVTRWQQTGKHQGPFMGFPPTGKDVVIPGILISRFENGKVVEEWEEANIAGLMKQLGASSPKEDETRIRSEINGYLQAWNAGDADALAAFYDEDGDRVNNSGDVFRGRAKIRDHYRKVFAISPPAGVERKLFYHDVGVRLISGNAAVVDILYEVSGIRKQVDFPVRGRNTVFMIKRNGRWMRTAHRNSLTISPDCLKLCNAKGLLPER